MEVMYFFIYYEGAMRYTRSALGLLNSQYRSVLKKCFLINLGLFIFASPSIADDSYYWNYETEGNFGEPSPEVNPIIQETKLSGNLYFNGWGPGFSLRLYGNGNTRLFSVASGITASITGGNSETFYYGAGESGGALLISTGGKFLAANEYGYGHKYFNNNDEENNKKFLYWSKDIKTNPEGLNFWFDFLEASGSELGKYSISSIGDRAKVTNDKNVKSIYYRTIPNIIFITAE